MNQIELIRKLRSARETCGISQEEAAAAIAAPRTAITQIEAGKRSVSTLELSKLAGRYRVPVAWFFEDGALSEDGNSVLALSRVVPGLENHPAVQAAVERCVDLFREGVQLEQLLGQQERSGPPSYPLNAPRTIGEAITEGERIAHDERQRIGLGNAPIADIPALLTTQGIWASGLKLPAQRVWLTINVIIVYTACCHQPLTGVVTHENHRRQPPKRHRPPPDRHRH